MTDEIKTTLTISSPAFEDGGTMPSKYTADGENVSPAIAWEAKSLVVIMDDPDIPTPWLSLFTWNHWIVFNIPPDQSSLSEAIPVSETVEGGALQGLTSYKKHGYGGPDPLTGTHQYVFKVYALDKMIDLMPREATKEAIMKAIKGHVLSYGVLVGKYKKQKRIGSRLKPS